MTTLTPDALIMDIRIIRQWNARSGQFYWVALDVTKRSGWATPSLEDNRKLNGAQRYCCRLNLKANS